MGMVMFTMNTMSHSHDLTWVLHIIWNAGMEPPAVYSTVEMVTIYSDMEMMSQH